MRSSFVLIAALLLAAFPGCQRGTGDKETTASSLNPAETASAPEKIMLEMEPGKRLGDISIGMTGEELEKAFPGGVERPPSDARHTVERWKISGSQQQKYEVLLKEGRVYTVSVNLYPTTSVSYAGKVLTKDLSLEKMAELLPACKRHVAEGASGFKCQGTSVLGAGLAPEKNPIVSVYSVEPEAGEASPQ